VGWRRREAGEGGSVPPPRRPPPPMARATMVQCKAPHRLHPGYGCSPGIATHCPRPLLGGGGAPQARAGWGCWREVRWLECGRQGRGNKFPLPVSPTPRGDIHTVHSMGRSWRRAGYGFPPAPPRIRLPTRYRKHGPRPGSGGAGRGVWVACRQRGKMVGGVRDRGGGTSSPSPSAPPPVVISTWSSVRE